MPTQTGKPPASTERPNNRRRRWPAIFLYLALAIILVLGLAECILRFGLGLGNPVLITPDPACEYILKPDQSVKRFSSHIAINHYGMRSGPIAPQKDPHTARLLFLGDSITYGTSGIDQSKIFTELIHRDLPQKLGTPVEVLNASASAWAIDNELRYLQSRGSFSSDLLILVLNSGDLTQARATISSVGEGLTLTKPGSALQEVYEHYILRRILHASGHVDAGDTPAPNAEATVQQNLAKLDLLKKYAEDHNMGFVVVFAPFRVFMDKSTGFAYRINQSNLSTLQSWSASRAVPLLDLDPVLSQHSAKEITLEGVHFNTKGHELAAQQIEDTLTSLHASHKILQQFP